MHVLFLTVAIVPLAAMLASLSAAVWLREGERREAPARARRNS